MLEKSAAGIKHKPFTDWLIKSKTTEKLFKGLLSFDCQYEYLDYFGTWIASSKHNSFIGLETLPHRYVSLGVTQAIDDWTLYCHRNNLRLRIFRGEYPYSKEFANWCWIEDKPLKSTDAVLISFPFSGSGNKHQQYDWLIKTCNELNIPVFIDCAFFGSCSDLEINFTQPCIDTVAFSLTKGFNAINYRSGIAYSRRSGNNITLDTQTSHKNGIHLNVAIGLELMKNFSPDILIETYKETQIKLCKELNLIPSNTVHLAIGDNEYNDYNRDGVYNRINLRNLF